MSLARRLLSLTRVKRARKLLAEDPSISNYIALATEHARRDEMLDASRVCEEGLTVYAGNAELQRLANRVRQLALEDRTRQLSRELREAPRRSGPWRMVAFGDPIFPDGSSDTTRGPLLKALPDSVNSAGFDQDFTSGISCSTVFVVKPLSITFVIELSVVSYSPQFQWLKDA